MTKWNDQIIKAEKRGKFTANDKRMANDVFTCGVGEVFDLIHHPERGYFTVATV